MSDDRILGHEDGDEDEQEAAFLYDDSEVEKRILSCLQFITYTCEVVMESFPIFRETRKRIDKEIEDEKEKLKQQKEGGVQ